MIVSETANELLCEPPYLVNTQTGEVVDICVEANDVTQDKELEHYSITPPVPYVPNKYKEKMKQYNKWLRGREKYLELLQRFDKKIKYIKTLAC